MKIVIHARHAELAADFREIAEEKLRTMDRFSVTIERVEVEILHEQNPRQGKHSHRVILTSHGAGPLMRAEAAEWYSGLCWDRDRDSDSDAVRLATRSLHTLQPPSSWAAVFRSRSAPNSARSLIESLYQSC